MAMTSIAITQDNIRNGCDLLAVHSPLRFIVEGTASEAVPPYTFAEYLDVTVTDLQTAVDYTGFKALQWRKIGNKCEYIFHAEKILRMVMGSLDDIETDEIGGVNYAKHFRLTFETGALSDSVDFFGYRCARQDGEYEAVEEICNNENETVIAFAGYEFYLHYYAGAVSEDIVFDGSPFDGAGMLRKRKEINTIGNYTAEVLKYDGLSEFNLVKTFNIQVLPACSDGLYVKFLDSSTGYYKHWLFNRFYLIEGEHSSIGDVEKFSTSLREGSQVSVGRKMQRKIMVTADSITQDELNYMVGIFSSPRVYIFTPDNTWLDVKVEDGTAPFKYRKGNAGQFSITLVEAAQNTVTML